MIAAFTEATGDEGAAAKAFIAQAAEDAAPDELPEIPPRRWPSCWRTSGPSRPAQGLRPVIRLGPVEDAPALERLEILQDDAPFLVDSIMGEIADQGLSVRAMFHHGRGRPRQEGRRAWMRARPGGNP